MLRWSVKLVLLLLLLAYIFCLPKQLFDVPYSTVVTDKQGELLGARIANDGQWRFPLREAVPEKLEVCLIEFEDRYYKYHWGVNPFSMGRALMQNVREKRIVSGGSTLSMQTIRLCRNKKRTVGEKLVEMILATRLEFRYSKKEILSLYVSHAPFGGNVVGLDAASWRYFGHSANQLSWAEAATLAVLPNSPSMIHLSKSRDLLLAKRNRLLKNLYAKGTFNEITYELAISEPLPGEPLPLPQTAPHLVDYFYKTKRGQQIETSINKGIQIQAENLLERWGNEFLKSDIRNLAAIVIDVQTNQVVAYCGNVRYQDWRSGNQVDVIRSPRSSGSILKPFLYYAALQQGDILPDMLLPDIPMNINGFSPQNFNMQYEGAVPASETIARSLNIPTVILLRKYGVPNFYNFLKEAGITTLTKSSSHYGLSLILGGAETTLWDVSNVYTQMARSLAELEQKKNLSLVTKENRTVEVFDPGGVWQTFDAIKEVNRPEEIDWRMIPSMQTVAWKTGTSYGYRDAWAVGVTPKFVVGVWVGNASGEGKPGLVGARTAGPVLFDLFNMLPSSPWFKIPHKEFTEVAVCRQSGHIKGRFCEEADSVLIIPQGLKTETCPYHHQITVTTNGNYRVYENCIGDEATVQQKWFTLPPAWEWYYKQYHPEYKSLPPFKKGCGEDVYHPMQFIYPQKEARIYVPKQLSGEVGGVTFELAHSNRNATVYWHLDENYLIHTRDFHKVTFTPSPGKHVMTVVDDEGNTLSIPFYVEE